MSEGTEIPEGLTKPRQIVREIAFAAKGEYQSMDSLGTMERVDYHSPNGAPQLLPNTRLPPGLSFLSISRRSGTYPDTAESGETYEVEVSIAAKTPRLIAPFGEYSE